MGNDVNHCLYIHGTYTYVHMHIHVYIYVRVYIYTYVYTNTYIHTVLPILQARDALAAEVSELKKDNMELKAQIVALQQHIGQIRQHTIGFILEQMNTLSLQDDTEV